MDRSCWELWAKSDAAGSPHSLVGHLLDAGAVGELIWDEFLAPATQKTWDRVTSGHGRDLFVFCCAVHDIGKATPTFQRKDSALWLAVRTAGLDGTPRSTDAAQRQHWRAGAYALDIWLQARDLRHLRWIPPLIEGHHGRHGELGDWSCAYPTGDGDATWALARDQILAFLLNEFDLDLQRLSGPNPTRAAQLGLAGYLVMADWIASSSEFVGTGSKPMGAAEARSRALAAWRNLGFSSGWRAESLSFNEPYRRFAVAEPRPLQSLTLSAAQAMDSPGLMIIEAPMGEGKTEAGLAAAEVLAARFGCDGLVFAMPTQGTTDAMYDRVVAWAAAIDPAVPVSLLHGKAMLNERWRQRREAVQETPDGLDEFGMATLYGEESPVVGLADPIPPEWVLGRHRGLLSHIAVATIDQVLYAATRTKFVSLRHAGLAGKVLVIDEVHSYDVYMSTFLTDLLKWCAEAEIPVVLMSATLAPSLRRQLTDAFRSGWDMSPPSSPAALHGYPRVTALSRAGEAVTVTQPYRTDLQVSIEVLSTDPNDVVAIAERIVRESSEGGCVLAIMNTVRRAQELYAALTCARVPVRLLHGRLTTAHKAERTTAIIDLLGDKRTRATGRPGQLVVVATQIAEQSFDVDVDLLITDLAPIDLLLQRIGRLHRHDRPHTDRPSTMTTPRTIVVGCHNTTEELLVARGFESVYSRYGLLRSAALLPHDGTWRIPSQVPDLVAMGYDDQQPSPPGWIDDLDSSFRDEQTASRDRVSYAQTFRLTGESVPRSDLGGLHRSMSRGNSDEARTVRDAEPTTEVALVLSDGRGFWALDGTPLGLNGERCSDRKIARKVWGDTVRLRDEPWVVTLRPLPAWPDLPLVGRLPALVLDEHRTCAVPGATMTYDDELGLLTERVGR